MLPSALCSPAASPRVERCLVRDPLVGNRLLFPSAPLGRGWDPSWAPQPEEHTPPPPPNSSVESELLLRSQLLCNPSGMDGRDGGNQLSSVKVAFNSSWENHRRRSPGKGCKNILRRQDGGRGGSAGFSAALCPQCGCDGVSLLLGDAWCQPWLGKGCFRESCGVQKANFALKLLAERCKVPLKADKYVCCSRGGVPVLQVVAPVRL